MNRRNDILNYADENYGTKPEYPWVKAPDYAVLKHSGNKKWYAVVMDVPKNILGLDGTEKTDILNVKCDPIMIGTLLTNNGFLPAYHMNKTNWVSIMLDSDVSINQIFDLLDLSYNLTSPKAKKGCITDQNNCNIGE